MTNIALSIIFIVFIFGGCSSDPEKPIRSEPPQTIVDAQIMVSDQVNKDVDGRPSPIVMKIFELRSIGKFEETDFYKLFEDATSSLGADLIATEQLHLHPGDNKKVKKPVSPDTKYIAVTAAFRDLNKAVWRGSIPIETAKTNQLKVTLKELAIGIEKFISTNNPNDAPVN